MKAKKILKQISALTLMGVMSAVQLTPAFCDTATTVSVNGDLIDFGTNGPIIIDGTTYVPIRAVFENFGSGTTVDWDSEEKAVTINYKGESLVLYTLTGEVNYKGESTTLANIPVINEGRTLLPLRELVEMLGGSLTWFADTKSIEVYENLGIIAEAETSLLDDFKDMPLPKALYVFSENSKKYEGIGFDDICTVADINGYDDLAAAAKEVAKTDAYEDLDTEENLPIFGKFSEEYFNAIIALKDKSFLTGTAKKAFGNDVFVADKGVTVADSIEKIYKMDFSKQMRINPETMIFAGIIYSGLDWNTGTNNFNEAMMLVYLRYMNTAHKDMWDVWDKLYNQDEESNKKAVKEAVNALSDLPLPQAIYTYIEDISSYSDDTFNELETIVKNANCEGYKELKKYTEKVIENGKNEDSSEDAVLDFAYFEMCYFEELSFMDDKSFMSDTYLKLFDNKDVTYSSGVTTLDSVNSLKAYFKGESKSVKVNKAYDALAKALVFMLKEGGNTYQTDEFRSVASLANTYIQLGLMAYDEFAKDFEKAGLYYKDVSGMTEKEIDDFLDSVNGEQGNV